MNGPTPPIKIEKQIVLVGAGNAHLVFLKRWRMKPLPGVSVLLVNESARMPYSAMVPGLIANEYRREEIDVDLTRLCQSAGARFLLGKVTSLDAGRRAFRVEGRAYDFGYDLLSLNLGAQGLPDPSSTHFDLRPISRLLDRLSALDELMTGGKHPKNLIVLGAGPSGGELAIALSHRYAALRPGIHVFEKQARPLPQFAPRAGRWFLDRFSERGIYFHPGTEPRLSESTVAWDDKQIEAHAVILATPGHPPALAKGSGLALSETGYVHISSTLQSVSHPEVYAVGDCAHYGPNPTLTKNGVYSVRMGKTLYDNVVASLETRPPVSFRPQRKYLALFNGGEGRGLLAHGGLAISGAWTRHLKDRIDRGWMKSLAVEPLEADPIRCSGCAAKVPASVLHASLAKTGIVAGSDDAEDSAIVSRDADGVTLSSLDFVPGFLDDPYVVGKITAEHCLSDLFAMNGTPESALVMLLLPWASGPLQKEWFEEAMTGVREVCAQHNVKLLGGHTGEGDKLCVGLSVTGRGLRTKLFLKRNLREGDRLVITKPLGSGTILAGWMRRMTEAADLQAAIASMLSSNAIAARALAEAGVTAATDVTGFGLAGHLREMLVASRKSATITPMKLPLLAGAERLSARGVRSSLFPENAKLAAHFEGDPGPYPILFDPQTSGGLLAGISEDRYETFQKLAQTLGQTFWEIGTVTAEPAGQITLKS